MKSGSIYVPSPASARSEVSHCCEIMLIHRWRLIKWNTGKIIIFMEKFNWRKYSLFPFVCRISHRTEPIPLHFEVSIYLPEA
jgi:hypothetical protein